MPEEVSPLIKFAYLGGGDGFVAKLSRLSQIAEPENWYYNSPNAKNDDQRQNGVLFQYIHHTFARAQDEGKILEENNCALMNTGLFTPNGEEIFAYFTPNRLYGIRPDSERWYLDSFLKESSHRIPENARSNMPEYVDYFADKPQVCILTRI